MEHNQEKVMTIMLVLRLCWTVCSKLLNVKSVPGKKKKVPGSCLIYLHRWNRKNQNEEEEEEDDLNATIFWAFTMHQHKDWVRYFMKAL